MKFAAVTKVEVLTTESGYKQYAGCVSVNRYGTMLGLRRRRIWYCAQEGCLTHVRAHMIERSTSPLFCPSCQGTEKRL